MGTLEKVIQLKKEGTSEADIINKLKKEGINPMEINDSLNQAKIKEAVGEKSTTEGMQPSIMGSEENPSQTEPIPTPGEGVQPQAPQSMTQGEYSPQAQVPQIYPEESYPQQETYQGGEEYYDEGSYGGEEGYGGYSNSTDTMIEVSEQVFSEKIKDITKELRELMEFKTIYSSRIDDMNERLKRIEKMFDKMQIAVLDKVGDFGKNIAHLKKEIEMVEDSFSKMHKK